MLQQSMPMSELPPDGSPPDLAHTLEEHLLAGFPPDLALDLVLNELVARAAAATAAGGAALALPRGDTTVCRATTGELAPGLGLTLNPADGLSGACLQTRQAQISVDTEADPRVDLTAAQHLGIRSILVVPVFRRKEEDAQHVSLNSKNESHDHQIAGSNGNEGDRDTELMGIIEVFSARPHAFSDSHQTLLQGFAAECARIRVVATELGWHKPVASVSDDFMPPPLQPPDFGPADFSVQWSAYPAAPTLVVSASPVPESLPVTGDVVPEEALAPEFAPAIRDQLHPIFSAAAPAANRPSYERWSLVLGGLVIAAAIGFSFMIGSRVGWLRPRSSQSGATSQADSQPCSRPEDPTCLASQSSRASSPSDQAHPSGKKSASNAERTLDRASARGRQKAKEKSATPGNAGELVVYEKGKVVFRMKPAPATAASATEAAKGRYQGSTSASETNGQDKNAVVEASSTARIAPSQSVWLSPQEAERRLLNRTEPKFPAEALAAHRAGNVVLEILVADDGTVSNIHTISGNPALASAAADAVRKWRYQPYRVRNLPSQFQTDVTLSFTAPN